ncbi:methyl-accepting chemotaxis protein [Noviherbaspirillum aridicola]|uniref:Methyl-accepting chemotaxis protein n=1 Tax=Noviherbaspirillum aridicola TaxID=2849687 RepID=A0ABQ4Q6Y7_9BURK|nr:methyl-accepting chemotaxis protein [Noviherbaspirillum aridicola]GIZ52996.1 methyl-accepting chemotaxis protein [Noviherbaspirillum aridicola]
MKFRNLHIGARLGLGFGLVLALLLGLAMASLSGMALIHNGLDKVINENDVIVKHLNDMRQAVMRTAVSVRNVSVMTNEDDVNAEVKQIEAAGAQYRESAEALAKMITDESSRALLTKVEAARVATAPGVEKAVGLAKRQGDVIPILLSDVVPQQKKWLEAMDEMVRMQESAARKTAEETGSAYDSARLLTIGLAAVALLLGAGIAWLVTRSITAPLHGALEVARRVADGDLTTAVKVDSQDETGQLLAALRDMNDSLGRIVSQVRMGTDAINVASAEIASGNADLSARTESQASALEQTASSMEELTSTVKHNADNASQANKLAATASDVAVQGGAVVSQVVETMGSINDSARKIVDIIGVIDGIAFQTNILALNAAVEAARAGEQGRGFAVVASEVRSLAQRSANAAKEIKTLISDSVEKVEAGSRLVDQAGSTMEEVVNSVRRVTDIISEIAAASQEQTAGIEQVNRAIAEMDNVTQQNAALVEEAAAAAASMQDQARQLSGVVSVFKVGGPAAPAAPASAPAAIRKATPAVPAPRTARPAAAAAAPVKTVTVPAAHPVPAASPRRLPVGAKTHAGDDDWEEF